LFIKTHVDNDNCPHVYLSSCMSHLQS